MSSRPMKWLKSVNLHLKLCSVSLLDRGNYTCRPASGGEASISLHVLEGDDHDDDEDNHDHD